ncbi:MAG: ABC transporter permease, partial [Propionibacteriaceae bacterium]|nr:ABC transporter permease [Propionibacteriaceae bacterium]
MLRQALRELRYHPSRFVATLVAIAISVAFMAGSSVIVATEQNGLERQQALPIAGADVVAQVGYDANSAGLSEVLTGLPEVAAAEPSLVTSDGLKHGSDFAYMNLIGLPSEPFRWSHLVDGRWPEGTGEITLTRGAAAGLEVAVGDTLGSSLDDVSYTVVGLTGEPNSLFLQTGYLAREAFARYDLDPDAGTGSWLVRGAQGVELDRVVGAVEAALPAGAEVDSAAALRAKAIEDLTDGFEAFRNLLWAFAAIAAVVGMITIANTFTILLAQRRRQIGLLRAVGAAGSQVRTRFLAEAVALGLLGAGLGVLLGIGLAAIGAAITGSLFWGLALPAADLAIAFVAGLLIT